MRRFDTSDHSTVIMQAAFAELDRLPAAEMLTLWDDIKHTDLSTTRQGPHVQARLAYQAYRQTGVGGIIVVAVGLLGIALSLAQQRS